MIKNNVKKKCNKWGRGIQSQVLLNDRIVTVNRKALGDKNQQLTIESGDFFLLVNYHHHHQGIDEKLKKK